MSGPQRALLHVSALAASAQGGATSAEPASAGAEARTHAAERHAFQTETKQLLNIVANSLYTDKHVFVRELVSNCSDALEKVRHRQVEGKPLEGPDVPLGISIKTDETTHTLIIEDSGIGMGRQELMDNLGTIAKSGSKAYLQRLREEQAKAGPSSSSTPPAGSEDVGSKIIGQFGVGFYSSFMVCDEVAVYSHSAVPGSQTLRWSSNADGSYEIAPVAAGAEGSDLVRGTRVVIRLKDSCREFASPATIKDILIRYSSFLSYPITLNGKLVNTVGAIWTKSKSEVSEEQYTAFYKYKSGDFEPPLYRLHFASDAPIALKALLYVGATHEEKYGMGRLRPGVDLYSRRVLIEAGSRIMPDWLRFVHGVVDSEDIPLNISRESMQDSALMRRLSSVLTRRVLRFLEAEARRDPETYAKRFFGEFGNFLKEGAVSDATYAPEVARLLRFESSAMPAGSLTSFDEYVSRCSPGQDTIYFLVAPHRGIAEASPYMEAFRGAGGAEGGVEVLFLYSPLDDFVMNNLREFNGRKLVTIETAELDASKLTGITKAHLQKEAAGAKGEAQGQGQEAGAATQDAAGDAAAAAAPLPPLSDAQVTELGEWLRSALPGRISKVRATTRLRSSPAVVTDHESAAVRRMMRMVEQTAGRDSEALRQETHMLPAQSLEVNPAHPVIVRLHGLRASAPRTALLVAEQMLDNALIAAGLVDDSRIMLPRLNALLELLVSTTSAGAAPGSAAAAAAAEGAAEGSSYRSYDEVVARRYTSPREAEDRTTLDAMKKAVDETMTPEQLAAMQQAAARLDAEERAQQAGGAGSMPADGARVRAEDMLRHAAAGGSFKPAAAPGASSASRAGAGTSPAGRGAGAGGSSSAAKSGRPSAASSFDLPDIPDLPDFGAGLDGLLKGGKGALSSAAAAAGSSGAGEAPVDTSELDALLQELDRSLKSLPGGSKMAKQTAAELRALEAAAEQAGADGSAAASMVAAAARAGLGADAAAGSAGRPGGRAGRRRGGASSADDASEREAPLR
jgi:HSP90 family molecular chaperone